MKIVKDILVTSNLEHDPMSSWDDPAYIFRGTIQPEYIKRVELV